MREHPIGAILLVVGALLVGALGTATAGGWDEVDWSSRWGRLPLDHDYVVAVDYISQDGERWQMVFAVTKAPRAFETRLWHSESEDSEMQALDCPPPEGLYPLLLELENLSIPVVPDPVLFLDGAFYDVTIKSGVSSHRFILTGPGASGAEGEETGLRDWLEALVKKLKPGQPEGQGCPSAVPSGTSEDASRSLRGRMLGGSTPGE